ncbi:methyltransferase family protein [Phormidium sp. CCY1219]|uniref:methyltransferase family protein n=1 Tax=Phormidium sp. CCY1219 TaxID=2886104 RepID=UPI002D1E958D|nr:isoprenylcysteine carboxylmethyltransferase family protein [Phormidium sp. CCY1219]MEB3831699.1 isoprenylcysteine carboxylmethyltransferase family protein [Phormidium sp. CCY1219]
MRRLLTKWGLNEMSWRGDRGEYWFLAQAVLIVAFVLLPAYRPPGLNLPSAIAEYALWGVAGAIALVALILIGKGLLDLGGNLTPLPYPTENGELVQTGIYGIVRHPLYGGLILGAIAWSLVQLSLSHLLGVALLFAFLDAKSRREEVWLSEKYPEYFDYRQRVKKLIPLIY